MTLYKTLAMSGLGYDIVHKSKAWAQEVHVFLWENSRFRLGLVKPSDKNC